MFRPANILVATDFSKESDRAVSAAFDIAGKYRSNIELLNVLDDVIECSADYCIPHEEVVATRSRMLKEARRLMKDQLARFPRHPKVSVKATVRIGDHFAEIMDEVKTRKIDLLVAAPHEEHKAWHMFSHFSEKLGEKAGCETLLVRH